MKKFFDKKRKFNQIVKEIKEVKIQGARNVAKKALYAYQLIPTKKSIKKLLSLRPTEPLLKNVLRKASRETYKEILNELEESQNKINKFSLKLIKNNDVIFTHCHSTTVTNALIYAKNQKKKFEVYNTETRPLFQGRKTSMELKKGGIKVTQFVDSAAMVALTKKQDTKKVDKFFIGADALLEEGVANKIGSNMFAKIAYDNKIPVYIFADSLKFSKEKIELEKRGIKEVWGLAKRLGIKVKNPAFEIIEKKYIKGIVTELGLMSYRDFLRKVRD